MKYITLFLITITVFATDYASSKDTFLKLSSKDSYEHQLTQVDQFKAFLNDDKNRDNCIKTIIKKKQFLIQHDHCLGLAQIVYEKQLETLYPLLTEYYLNKVDPYLNHSLDKAPQKDPLNAAHIRLIITLGLLNQSSCKEAMTKSFKRLPKYKAPIEGWNKFETEHGANMAFASALILLGDQSLKQDLIDSVKTLHIRFDEKPKQNQKKYTISDYAIALSALSYIPELDIYNTLNLANNPIHQDLIKQYINHAISNNLNQLAWAVIHGKQFSKANLESLKAEFEKASKKHAKHIDIALKKIKGK